MYGDCGWLVFSRSLSRDFRRNSLTLGVLVTSSSCMG
jgi:hypothetical protein